MIVALAGGVGGAKLALGLSRVLGPEDLTIVVNTGDDFTPFGLHVAPDLDTVMYTLAGLNNRAQGWGLEGESWAFMAAMDRLGGDTWFRLGDQDLATHVERTRRLRRESLSDVTADFCARLGVRCRVVPMSDDPVRTMVDTDLGRMAFQDYFVRHQCGPRFVGVDFEGIETARPARGFLEALHHPDLDALLICPSNPLLSIRPMLSLPGIVETLMAAAAPVVAVSPFIAGQAVKGPAAKMLRELDVPVTPPGLMNFYDRLLDGLVIDKADAAAAADIARPRVLATDILMRDDADKVRLAREVLAFARRLRR